MSQEATDHMVDYQTQIDFLQELCKGLQRENSELKEINAMLKITTKRAQVQYVDTLKKLNKATNKIIKLQNENNNLQKIITEQK